MTAPAVQTRNQTNSGANATTTAIVLPSGIQSGDLLIVAVTKDGTGAFSGWPAGWNQIAVTSGQSQHLTEVRYKIAVAGEGGFTLSHASEGTAQMSWRINGHNRSVNPQGSAVDGSSTNPNPPSQAISPASRDYLLIAIASNDGNVAITAAPTNYTTGFANERWANSNGVGIARGERTLSAATSPQDPGTFTMNTEQWHALTIAILGDGFSGDAAGAIPIYTGTADGEAEEGQDETGSASGALAIYTATAAGEPATPGTAAGTLPIYTATATGRPNFVGSAAGVLPMLTATAAGTPALSASASGVLAPMVGAAQGVYGHDGTASGALPPLTATASGAPAVAANAAGTLPAYTATTDGFSDQTDFVGEALGVMPALTATATGTPALSGIAAGTLAPMTGEADGVLEIPPPPVPPPLTDAQIERIAKKARRRAEDRRLAKIYPGLRTMIMVNDRLTIPSRDRAKLKRKAGL